MCLRTEAVTHIDNVAAVYSVSSFTRLSRPVFASRVSAGFPSPAEQYIEGRLDLNRHLIRHPIATFYVRVEGDSMIGAGIQPDDLLLVDRAEEAGDGHIIIARLNDELCVKRLRLTETGVELHSENPKYQPIIITEEMDFEVWGRVLYAIHKL